MNGGKAPLTYHLFQKLLECVDPPERAVPSIDKEFLGTTFTPTNYDHDEIYGVPVLEELGKYIYNIHMYIRKHVFIKLYIYFIVMLSANAQL